MLATVDKASKLVRRLGVIARDTDDATPILVIMAGAPASGKSTIRAAIAHSLPDGRIVSSVCPDDIRRVVNGDEASQENAPLVWKTAFDDLRRLLGMDCMMALFDSTASKPRDRRRLADVAHKHGGIAVTVWLDTPLDECIARNEARDRVVPVGVIRRMHANLQANPPTRDDFVDHVIILRLGQRVTCPVDD